MTICKKCGKEFEGEGIYCTPCRWEMKWPSEILNAPELASRRKRSHSLKILSLDKENTTAEFQSSRNGKIYQTTLGRCTCKDFALGRGEYPCKHILRLAEELGVFKNEKFEKSERDYTLSLNFSDLTPEKKILPLELREQSEEVISRYIEILRFIYLGRKNKILQLEKQLDEIELNVTKIKELDIHDRKSRYKILEDLRNYRQLSGKSRIIERYKRVSEYDFALEMLHFLNLIKVDNSNSFSTVIMPSWMSLNKLEQTLSIYGVYLPLFLQKVSDNCGITLHEVMFCNRRSEIILRPYNATSTPQWAYHVPECFNDALDIRLISRKKNFVEYTVWTQGINFAFDAGYMIYRNQKTYEAGTPAIQIISAKKAYGTKLEKLGSSETIKQTYEYDEELIGRANYYPGEVVYRDFETGDIKVKSQMDFVKMLIGIN